MSRVSLFISASQMRSLLVVLAVVGVVGLAQGGAGPLRGEGTVAAPLAALPQPAAAPTPAPPTLFLPHVTRQVALPLRFQAVASPNVAFESVRLMAVDLLNARDGWAVGGYDANQASLTLRWNGVAWQHVPSPNPNTGVYHYNTLEDVVAITANDAWAASGGSAPLLHWDGQAWSLVSLGLSPQNYSIYALDATASNDVWAVGSIAVSDTLDQWETLTLHWDGVRWSRIPSPRVMNYSRLRAVAARAPNDIWAVGDADYGFRYDARPLILHWDGVAWRQSPLPYDAYGRLYVLQGVTAPAADRVWVVGWFYPYAGTPQPVCLRWNGTSWTFVPLPWPSTPGAHLNGVAELPDGEAFAVGNLYVEPDVYRPWLIDWEGGFWAPAADAPALDAGVTPAAIDASGPETLMVVGVQRSGASFHAWSLYRTGDDWRQPSHPEFVRPHSRLNGVAGVSATDLWAVGASEAMDSGELLSGYDASLLLHWDGQAWTAVEAPHFEDDASVFTSVAAVSASDVWAVGGQNRYGRRPLILHWDGARWQSAEIPNGDGRLMGVAARAADDVWAVGFEGAYPARPVVLHWDGHTWAARPVTDLSPDNMVLNDVAPLARDDVWAVGYTEDIDPNRDLAHPLLLRWNGAQWSTVPAPGATGEGRLTCVTALAPDAVWAMGQRVQAGTTEPVALRWDGRAWTALPGLALNAVHSELQDCLALSPTEVYAVGWLQATADGPSESLVVRWDGTRWTRLASDNPGGQVNRLAALTVTGDTLWTVGYSEQPGWPMGGRATLVERASRGWYATPRH